MKNLLKRLFVVPGDQCPVCGRVLFEKGAFVCANCQKLLPENRGPVCERCGRALLDEKTTVCKECQRITDAAEQFHGGFSWLAYDDIAAKIMTDFKFHHNRGLARWTGERMADAALKLVAKDVCADTLIPVPLHPNRVTQRGYNQSAVIAAGIAEKSGLRLTADALVRRIDTPHQLGADRMFRLTNVTDAFDVRTPENVADKRIILVDDVMTTGATLRACTRALKQAGAVKVYVMTAAATV